MSIRTGISPFTGSVILTPHALTAAGYCLLPEVGVESPRPKNHPDPQDIVHPRTAVICEAVRDADNTAG